MIQYQLSKVSGRPLGVSLCVISVSFGCPLANDLERDMRSISHPLRSVPWLNEVPKYLAHPGTEVYMSVLS